MTINDITVSYGYHSDNSAGTVHTSTHIVSKGDKISFFGYGRWVGNIDYFIPFK